MGKLVFDPHLSDSSFRLALHTFSGSHWKIWSIRVKGQLRIAQNKGDRKSQKGELQGACGISRVMAVGSQGQIYAATKETECSWDQGAQGPGRSLLETKMEPAGYQVGLAMWDEGM